MNQRSSRSCFTKAEPLLGAIAGCCVLFFPPQNPLLFTLQQSLLYARPPPRQSPAQPCTVARGSHHFQVCLHCFPCFRSQRDQTINRQLKEKGKKRRWSALHGCGSSVRRDETHWCVWFLRFTASKPQRGGKQVPWHLEQLTLPLLSPVSVIRTISWLFTLIDFAGICHALDI